MPYSDSKKKYWYKQKSGKPGKQLPAKYKRMFANKQIVCIEYMEISEDDEREIFRVRRDHTRLAFAHYSYYILACTTWYGAQLCRENEGRGPHSTADSRTRTCR